MRALLVTSVVGALAVVGAAPAHAGRDLPAPTALTPEGPGTLSVLRRGAIYPSFALAQRALVGLRVRVGPGGRAGRLRPRDGASVLGPWTDVPAAPGTYLLPTARRPWYDPFDTGIAVDQDVGGQAIVAEVGCEGPNPQLTQGQCATELRLHGGDPPPGPDAPVTVTRLGSDLALAAETAPDADGDGLPDAEDPTPRPPQPIVPPVTTPVTPVPRPPSTVDDPSTAPVPTRACVGLDTPLRARIRPSLAVRVLARPAGTYAVELRVPLRRGAVVARASVRVGASEAATAQVRLTARQRRSLLRGLAPRASRRATVTVSGGGAAPASRVVRLVP